MQDATPQHEESKASTYACDYAREYLAKELEKAIESYSRGVLISSERELRERSELVVNAKRSVPLEQGDGLVEILRQHLTKAEKTITALEEDRAEIKSGESIRYGQDQKDREAKANKLIADANTQISKYGSMIQRLEKCKDISYLLFPVRNPQYTAIRIVLPIDAKTQIPAQSLIDYVYTAMNTQIAITFQQEAFNDCSLEYIVQSSVQTKDREFHAIDIIHEPKNDEETRQLLEHISDFISGIFNTGKKIKSGTIDTSEETKEANLKLNSLIIHKYHSEFLERYMDDVKKDISDLLKELGNHISDVKDTRTAEKIIDNIFTLGPYKKSLTEICESHKTRMIEKFYTEVLQEEYQPESIDQRDDQFPVWIEKEKAKSVLFMTLPPDAAETTYRIAVENNALNVKIEGGIEYVNIHDILALPQKVLVAGCRIRGIYDEPVILSPEFSRKHNLDNEKLKRLALAGTIPTKEIKRDKHDRVNRYVIRQADTDHILKIYNSND